MWKTCPQGVHVRSSPGASSSRQVEHCTLILASSYSYPSYTSSTFNFTTHTSSPFVTHR